MGLSAQLDFIKWLQKLDNPAFVDFVKFLNFFDTGIFYLLLIPITWCLFGPKQGYKLLFILVLSHIANHYLKIAFGLPRPFMVDPSVGIIHVHGNGFPSGAAQTALLLAGILIYNWRSRLSWVIGITYFLLISYSRVYLGVHFPTDILGGWLVGAGLLVIYIYGFPIVEKGLRKWSAEQLLILQLFVWGGLHFFLNWVYASAGLGLAVGNYFSGKLKKRKQNRIVSLLICLIGLYGILSLTKMFGMDRFFRYFLAGVWIPLISPGARYY